jgi:hypothetical protein
MVDEGQCQLSFEYLSIDNLLTDEIIAKFKSVKLQITIRDFSATMRAF